MWYSDRTDSTFGGCTLARALPLLRVAEWLHRFVCAHCPTQNRFALLLEMLSIRALSNAKPLRSFAGNAFYPRIVQRKTASHFCWKCFFSAHYPTQNRFALLLEMLSA